jgi:outer membrane protein OmpA-like peptidoglycan-associated protein
LTQHGWTAIPPPFTPYDPSFDQKINEYKRQLETIRLQPSTSQPKVADKVKTATPPSSVALSPYEEKLKKLQQEQQAKNTIPASSQNKSTPAVQQLPSSTPQLQGPDVSGNNALKVYEEKLRKMEEKRQQQAANPVAQPSPQRIEKANTKDSVEIAVKEEDSIHHTNPRTSFVYIPEKDSMNVDSSGKDIIYCEVLPSDDLALLEKKLELEKEIERLLQEKENLTRENTKTFNDTGAILANTEQLLSEKESLALSITQLLQEREQLELEKQKLESEQKKLELLRSQQFKDINSLKKELDSLLKIREQAISMNKNFSTVVDELESSTLEIGKVLSMKNVYFVANASFLQSRSYEELDKLVLYLKKNNGVHLEIGGHTNGLCDDAFCNELSQRRAKAVVDYLISKGIESSRLSYKGYGKTQNIADNRTEEGRKLNQRVEIKITGLGN